MMGLVTGFPNRWMPNPDTTAPGKVKAVLLNKTSAVSMDVSWETPEFNSTCITGYRVYWGVDNSAAIADNMLHYHIDDLEACTEYNVSVVAMAEQGGADTLSSTSVSNQTTTDVATPGKVGNLTTREVTATSLNISWLPTTHQACITGYTVCWDSRCTNIRDQHYLIQALLPCTEYSVWVAAVADTSSSDSVDIKSTTTVAVPGPVIDLQAANTTSQTVDMMWTQPRTNWTCVKEYKVCWKDGSTAQTCTITDNTSYTITHLMAATNYSVQVGALNVVGELSAFSDISIFTDTLPLAPHTPVTPVIIAVIVILTAGISATVLYMHCKGILLWPPNKHLDPGVRPPPIPLKTFDGQCRQLLDTPSRLSNEYQLLATLCSDISTTQPSLVGQQIDNRKKNRYVNIIPYDATRVKLDIIGGDYATDYINASFIKGYSSEEEYIATQGPKEETCRDHDASGEEEYIATQGPKEETCADFWRMVYQHNVKLIVMVTQFEEQNKMKCHRYFPPLRENLVIGDFVVRCTTELSFPMYTDRTLVIHKNGRKKSVKHLHFQEWPDFGCPENTHSMLQFCSTMRQHIEDDAGLTVVHCSAGVGRTGTLIALDILLQHIKENKKIDIFNTVYQLRQQRTNMVQTELQYKYIYQCLLEALQDAAFIHPGKLSSPAQSPEPIYENMLGHSPYEKLVKGDTRGKYSFNTNSSIL
uniref:Protein-tyrosine-phosphatase n=1 Tax=Timema monikensis TaxID=170555 RepID=A0A7R9E3N9_9NEOP|nr:unnamed protein product [Timema monikensis]